MLVILSHLNTCNLSYASSMVLYLAFNWFVFKKSNNKCQKHHPIHHHPPPKKKHPQIPPLFILPFFPCFLLGCAFFRSQGQGHKGPPRCPTDWGDFHLPPMVGLPYARSSRPSSGRVTFRLEGFDGSDLEGGSCTSVRYGSVMVVRWLYVGWVDVTENWWHKNVVIFLVLPHYWHRYIEAKMANAVSKAHDFW